MKKYGNKRMVSAVYDDKFVDNPFLAAMPEMLSVDAYMEAVKGLPPLPSGLSELTFEERRQETSMLASIFVPMPFMYSLYDTLYRAIRTTYTTRTELESIRQINAIFGGNEPNQYATQADTGSILGIPGIGKTSVIRRSLVLMPQVIEHTEYRGKPFFCKQVLYLHIECPSDCSVKTLAMNLIGAIDRAIGSNYLNTLLSLRSAAASAIAAQIKILCMTHHIGLILVDEIQNVITTAQKNHQTKPLIKFLVELTNDTCTSVYFIGTPDAEEVFTRQEHLKRRTRGIRLLPLKPDGTYRVFLSKIWPYQLTPEQAPMTDKMVNKLFDYSGGIPAYIVKIFQEAQVKALMAGRSCIDEKIVQQTVDTLAIRVPKTYSGGTYLSDFDIASTPQAPVASSPEPATVPTNRSRNRLRNQFLGCTRTSGDGKMRFVMSRTCWWRSKVTVISFRRWAKSACWRCFHNAVLLSDALSRRVVVQRFVPLPREIGE